MYDRLEIIYVDPFGNTHNIDSISDELKGFLTKLYNEVWKMHKYLKDKIR